MSINSTVIAGNLVRDVEMRATASGTEIAKFTVAVNEREKVGDEWQDVASFIDCVAFGHTAKYVANVEKGARVAVQGRLKQSRWETDSGEKRSRVEVVVNEVLLPPRDESAKPYSPAPSADPDTGEEIPF